MTRRFSEAMAAWWVEHGLRVDYVSRREAAEEILGHGVFVGLQGVELLKECDVMGDRDEQDNG